MELYDFIYKCIVVGDGGVGKTALAIRLCKGFFIEDYKLTIGVDFYVKTIEIDDFNIELQIWDTGGQERFNSIRSIYYRGTRGAAIVFDLSNQESFEHIPRWVDEIKRETIGDIPILLIGNKSDLINSREVTSEDIYNITRRFNLLYMETSAKTGAEVSKGFDVLTHLIMDLQVLQVKDTTIFKIEPQEPEIKINKETEKQIKIEKVLRYMRETRNIPTNTEKKKRKKKKYIYLCTDSFAADMEKGKEYLTDKGDIIRIDKVIKKLKKAIKSMDKLSRYFSLIPLRAFKQKDNG